MCIRCYGTHCNEKTGCSLIMHFGNEPHLVQKEMAIPFVSLKQGQHLWYHFTDHWHKVEEMNITRRNKTEECSTAIQAACTSGKLYLDPAPNKQ